MLPDIIILNIKKTVNSYPENVLAFCVSFNVKERKENFTKILKSIKLKIKEIYYTTHLSMFV